MMDEADEGLVEFFRHIAPHVSGVIEMSDPVIVEAQGQEVTLAEIVRRVGERISPQRARDFARRADAISVDGDNVSFIGPDDSWEYINILTLTRKQVMGLGLTLDK
jgi:hypothetical protein